MMTIFKLKRPLKENYIHYLLEYSKKNNEERNAIKDGTLQKSELVSALEEGALAIEKTCEIENLEGFFYLKEGKIYSTNGLNEDLEIKVEECTMEDKLIVDLNEQKFKKNENNEGPFCQRKANVKEEKDEKDEEKEIIPKTPSDETNIKKVNWDMFFTGEVELKIEDYIDILLLLEKCENRNIDISYYHPIRTGKKSFKDYGIYWYFNKEKEELIATKYTCENDNINISQRVVDYINEHTYFLPKKEREECY